MPAQFTAWSRRPNRPNRLSKAWSTDGVLVTSISTAMTVGPAVAAVSLAAAKSRSAATTV
jgi:hypothetical protein